MSKILEVRGLSKSYMIKHEGKENYTALRDVLSNNAKKIFSFSGWKPKKFTQEEFWALKDIDFDIEAGDRVGIIGRNGAGKSTLLKILSRITEPRHGSIKIKGRIASLLEVGTGFHPELSGRENIFLNGAILGMSRNEIKKHFDAIVEFAEVEKFLDTPVKRYSSGMYVRLAFAVAAHLEPEILIVDEVLAVGDAQFQKKCLGKMEDVSKNEGRTILFVSHNMGVVSQLCKTGILLNRGEIEHVGEIETTIEKYFNKMVFAGAYEAVNTNKEYYISHANVYDNDGNSNSSFMTDDIIKLRFGVAKKIIKSDVNLSCTIQNKNGDFLTTFVVNLADFIGDTDSFMQYEVSYPAHLIAPGSYAFRLALFQTNGLVYDLAEMMCSFSVFDSGTSMAAFESSNYGYFFTNHVFKKI